MSYDANEDRYEEEPVARRRRGSGGELTADDKQWGMFCHLSSLAGFVVPGGNIIGPVVCWMMKKEESRFVDYHGKESVNFQISMLVYILICVATVCGIVLVPVVGIYALVMPIIAGLKAQEGERYEYQMIFRILK